MTLYSDFNRQNAGAEALKHGESQLGLPYIWGGETPGVGFDCSGLTQWMYRSVGVYIPRTTESQFRICELAKGSPLLRGDLMFMGGSDGTSTLPGHVVVYHSPGLVLQAPFTGENIQISAYDTDIYDFVTRPGNLYGPTIHGPTIHDLKANGLVRLTTLAQATLTLRNGWQVRGWDGSSFPVLSLNGMPAGTCMYAVINFRNKR